MKKRPSNLKQGTKLRSANLGAVLLTLPQTASLNRATVASVNCRAPRLDEITPDFLAGDYVPRAMGVNVISCLSCTP